jgi:hypothetical protein
MRPTVLNLPVQLEILAWTSTLAYLSKASMTTKNIYETLSVFVIDPMKGQARVFVFANGLRNSNVFAYFLMTEKKVLWHCHQWPML